MVFSSGVATAAFASANAGLSVPVAISNLSLSGADAINYNVADITGVTANITPATLTATVNAFTKVYDGNTTATPTLTITSGLVGSETLGLTGTATFADKNVGTAKTVTVNTVSLSDGNNGGLASNYSLAAGETTSANITPKALTISACLCLEMP